MVILVWFILFFMNIHSVFGLRCLECSDMPTPTDCNRITTCGPTESCYVEQLVTSGGVVLYNSGCRSQFRCAGPQGKRFLASSTDIVTCSQCCDSEFCNLGGCGIAGKNIVLFIFINVPPEKRCADSLGKRFLASSTDIVTCSKYCDSGFGNLGGCSIAALSPPQRGIYCFECDAQKTPDTCRDVVMCDFEYTCLLEKVTDVTEPFYRSYCIEEKACKALEQVATMTGRRRQTVDHCPMCCRDDFCNDNCRRNITATTDSTSRNTTLILPTYSTTLTSTYMSSPLALSTASVKSTALVLSSSSIKLSIITADKSTSSSLPTSTVQSTSTVKSPTSSISTKSAYLTPSSTKSAYLTPSSTKSAYPTPTSTKSAYLTPSSTKSAYPTPTSTKSAYLTPSSTKSAYLTPSSTKSAYLTPSSTKSAYPTPTSTATTFTRLTSTFAVSITNFNPTTNVLHSTINPVTSESHWSEWGTWSRCHCHAYTQSRHRHCIHGHHNQHHCPGSGVDIRPCVQPNTCHTHTVGHTVSHTTTGPNQHCDTSSGYHLVKKHSTMGYMCLKLYRTPKTWIHAKAQCHDESQGQGQLIVLDNPAKENTLTIFLHDMHAYSTLNAIWLGMSFQHKAWQWVTGAVINTHHSHTIQQFVTQNSHPHFNCAAKMKDDTWKTLQCFEEHGFVCEILM